jgi:hypothetical protein
VHDRRPQRVHDLLQVQRRGVGQRRRDVELGGVALLHAVGDEDDPVAGLHRELLQPERPLRLHAEGRSIASSTSSTRPALTICARLVSRSIASPGR